MAKKDEVVSKEEADSLKSVNEALKKEQAKQPKGKNHYKIFRVEKDPKTGSEKKITMTKFWAKDDHEAYEELKKYRKVASKAYTYYFGATGNFIDSELGEDGKVKRYDDHEELVKAWKSRQTMASKIKDVLLWPLELIWDKTRDGWWWLCDTLYLLKSKHGRNESWSLDCHLVDDIIYNIQLLIKYKHGVPTEFCMKARAELHKSEKSFDVRKSFEKNPASDDRELELADKMWSEELERGLLYAKLYTFYHEYGQLDEDAWPECKKFEKDWSKTIPHVPGAYHEIDFEKLRALENKYWNSLWNWIKDNGRNLWD